MNDAEDVIPNMGKFDYLFVAGGSDFRAYEALRKLGRHKTNIGSVLLFEFNERAVANPTQYNSYKELDYNFSNICCSIKDPSECIKAFMETGIELKQDMKVAIDISCFTKPYFFVILKYLRDCVRLPSITVFYTEPKSYMGGSVLKSYHSTSGPLSVMEIPGFPGEEFRNSKKVLVVLLGFDGELSSFITDEISPEKTIVVNGFPGYFPKFKDISMINNEKMVGGSDVKFARGNNPFEVYNLLQVLHKSYSDNTFFNIAPLGTKPMALGACLFAINNPTVRIVYPLPEKYESVTTDRCWSCWAYNIPLFI
jgi:hypothetical protein